MINNDGWIRYIADADKIDSEKLKRRSEYVMSFVKDNYEKISENFREIEPDLKSDYLLCLWVDRMFEQIKHYPLKARFEAKNNDLDLLLGLSSVTGGFIPSESHENDFAEQYKELKKEGILEVRKYREFVGE